MRTVDGAARDVKVTNKGSLIEVCYIVFDIPLYAARRATEAAEPLLKQRRLSFYDRNPVPGRLNKNISSRSE